MGRVLVVPLLGWVALESASYLLGGALRLAAHGHLEIATVLRLAALPAVFVGVVLVARWLSRREARQAGPDRGVVLPGNVRGG